MTYSSDEIESGVSQIVQGSPTFKRDGLGGRNVKERFEETRELVNSTLLYEPDSVYYLIQKASIRTRRQLNSVLSVIDLLEDDIDGMAVPSKDVRDTTALADAGNALAVIDGALARRGSISDAEWQRYERATDRALTIFKESAKRTYTPFSGSTAVTDVVKASAESASSLLSNFRTLQSEYDTLLTAVDRLIAGFGNYNHKRIVTAVASRQMSRLQSAMDALEEDFDSKTPNERSKTVRSDTLTVLTNRASVKALSRIRYPGDPKISQTSTGATEYRASAYGTGGAPVITGSVSAPWAILNSHELRIDFGGTVVTVPLVPGTPGAVQGVKAASITGYAAESTTAFAINGDLTEPWPLLTPKITTGGTYALTGFYFYLVINGVTFTITDSPGNPWTYNPIASQLASVLGTRLGSYGDAAAQTDAVDDWVEISYDTTPRPPNEPDAQKNRYLQVATGPLNAPVMASGWRVDVNGTEVAGTLSTGWDGNNELWLWPNDLAYDRGTETGGVQVTLTSGTWPSYIVTASSIEADIDGATGEVDASVDAGRVKITSSDVGEGSIVKVITSALSGGRKTPSIRGAETLGFVKDQEVRESGFRAQALIDVLNNNTNFAAVATAAIEFESLVNTTRAYGQNPNIVKFSADSSLTADAGELKLVIEAGENSGTYGVNSYNFVGGELSFTLDRNLRIPTEVSMRVRVYRELLVITSKASGTSAYIDVDQAYGPSAHTALGLPTELTRGNVSQLYVEYNDPAKGWIAANLKGLGIKIGDVILLENGTNVGTITGIDSISSGILDVTPVDPTLSLTAFSIESVSSDTHSAFNASLTSWKDGLSSSLLTLSALEKSINTLLKLVNPDRGRVQVAADALSDVRTSLESGLLPILESYSVPSVPAVDRALEVMSEQGHDRARDLLTSAQFTEYNKTTYKTSSSSGAMMDAASKVATNDLVEPTKTRGEFVGEIDKLISSTHDEIDPKYDFRDARADSAPVYLDYFLADVPE